jgi:hypothetical protein
MAFQNPFAHRGRSSARSWRCADGSRSAGFIEETGSRRRRSSSRVGWRARGRWRTPSLIWQRLSQSGSTERKSSQKVRRAFGVSFTCSIRGRRLGEPSGNGSTGSPCMSGNWRFSVYVFFSFKDGCGPKFTEWKGVTRGGSLGWLSQEIR